MDQDELVILDIMMNLQKKLTISIDKSKTVNGMRTGEEVLSFFNETEKGKSITKKISHQCSRRSFINKYKDLRTVIGCYKKGYKYFQIC
ncbi:MAG: hypothetical protein ISS16_06855 [Ignavibacteria bacterium]|nr:hypothetical protein [Ignavibacteria bacterium]